MSRIRAGAVAAPLPDGRVLVAAGGANITSTLDTAEIFDPKTNCSARWPRRWSTRSNGGAARPLETAAC